MMFSAMGAFQGSDTGFPIRYRLMAINSTLEGGMPKLRYRLMCYANDVDKNASSEAKIQNAMDELIISTKKTEVVHQPSPRKPYNVPIITVIGQKQKIVDKFTYLGTTLSPEQCTLMMRSLP